MDYFRERKDVASCNSITLNITCYRGDKQDPEWMDIECGMHIPCWNYNGPANETKAMYSTVCTVTADTSRMAKGLRANYGSSGEVYWCQSFSVVLLFGLTELKAQISWTEGVSIITMWTAPSTDCITIGEGAKVGTINNEITFMIYRLHTGVLRGWFMITYSSRIYEVWQSKLHELGFRIGSAGCDAMSDRLSFAMNIFTLMMTSAWNRKPPSHL